MLCSSKILVEKDSTARFDDNPENIKLINKCHRHYKSWNMTSLYCCTALQKPGSGLRNRVEELFCWGSRLIGFEALGSEVFCYSEEGVELLLGHINLPLGRGECAGGGFNGEYF